MRARRWGDGRLIGRHARRDRRVQLLTTRVTQAAPIVNLKVAKALVVTIPQSILPLADEVIR